MKHNTVISSTVAAPASTSYWSLPFMSGNLQPVHTVCLISSPEIPWRAKTRTGTSESRPTWSSSPRCFLFVSLLHCLSPEFWSGCIVQLKYSILTRVIFIWQTPLTESLIEFTDPAMNRVAADLFLCKFPSSYIIFPTWVFLPSRLHYE